MERLLDAIDKILEKSIYTLAFCIPLSKSLMEISISVAIIAWVAKKILMKKFTLAKTPLNTLLFAFLMANLISFVNADFRILFMRAILTKCLKYILVYFITVEVVNSKERLRDLLIMIFIASFIVMIDAYLQYYIFHVDILNARQSLKYAPATNWTAHKGFPTGTFASPNGLAAWMLAILFPALSLFFWGIENIRTKLILGCFLPAFFFLFYLTNSLGAWIGFFISSFAIFFIRSKKLFLVSVIIFVFTASFMFFILPKKDIDEIISFSSVKDRLYMWSIGWKIFMEHPIIGNGLNNFYLKFQETRDDEHKNKVGSYAHNGFLQITAEIGIVGLVIFLLVVGKAFYVSYKYISLKAKGFEHAFTLGLLGGLLAFLVHSFFDTNLQSLPLVVLFWFMLGILASVKNIYTRNAYWNI